MRGWIVFLLACAVVAIAPAAKAQTTTGAVPPAGVGSTVTNVTVTGGKNGNGNATALAVDVNGVVSMFADGNAPSLQAGLSTTVQTVVGSAADVEGYYCWNPNSSVAYVQLFDVSGSVTLGSTAPKWSIGIPPTSAANLAGLGLKFANAVKVASTTTATGSTANSTALDCNFAYHVP